MNEFFFIMDPASVPVLVPVETSVVLPVPQANQRNIIINQQFIDIIFKLSKYFIMYRVITIIFYCAMIVIGLNDGDYSLIKITNVGIMFYDIFSFVICINQKISNFIVYITNMVLLIKMIIYIVNIFCSTYYIVISIVFIIDTIVLMNLSRYIKHLIHDYSLLHDHSLTYSQSMNLLIQITKNPFSNR